MPIAPSRALTMQRVVSLEDYALYALNQADVAKALATWTWDGQERVIYLTVAGQEGASIPNDSLETVMSAEGFQKLPSASMWNCSPVAGSFRGRGRYCAQQRPSCRLGFRPRFRLKPYGLPPATPPGPTAMAASALAGPRSP